MTKTSFITRSLYKLVNKRHYKIGINSKKLKKLDIYKKFNKTFYFKAYFSG